MKLRNLSFFFLFISIQLICFSQALYATHFPTAKYLTEYDYEEFKQFSRICDVAYGLGKSDHEARLKEQGWEFSPLSDPSITDDFLGVKAINGPTVVLAYSGTDIKNPRHRDAIGSSEPVCMNTYFPDLRSLKANKGFIFKGFIERYMRFASARSSKILRDLDPDQRLIFEGHSMGGATACISFLDWASSINEDFQKVGNPYSLLTIGAPPCFNSRLETYIVDNHFLGASKMRLFLSTDPIVQFTYKTETRKLMGLNIESHSICKVETGECDYTHADAGIELESCLPNWHMLSSDYIPAIDQKPKVLRELWDQRPLNKWDKYWDASKRQIELDNSDNDDDEKIPLRHYEEAPGSLTVEGVESLFRRSIPCSCVEAFELAQANIDPLAFDALIKGFVVYHPQIKKFSANTHFTAKLVASIVYFIEKHPMVEDISLYKMQDVSQDDIGLILAALRQPSSKIKKFRWLPEISTFENECLRLSLIEEKPYLIESLKEVSDKMKLTKEQLGFLEKKKQALGEKYPALKLKLGIMMISLNDSDQKRSEYAMEILNSYKTKSGHE